MKIYQLLLGAALTFGSFANLPAEILYQGTSFGLTLNSIPGVVEEAPFVFDLVNLTLLTGNAAYASSPTSYASLQVGTAPTLFGRGTFDADFQYWATGDQVVFGSLVGSGNEFEPEADVTSGYYGWYFKTGSDLYYGWALINTSNNTIDGIAINTVANQSIIVGAVPEPSSALLLGLGAAYLLATRKRKRG